MKKPWLITQLGQRWTVWLGWLLAVLLLFSLVPFVLAVTAPRTEVPQLNSANLVFCEIRACDDSNPLGLKVRDVTMTESEAETMIRIDFVNQPRWHGERVVIVEFRLESGEIKQMVEGNLVLSDKEAQVQFSFTGSIPELNELQWFLGL